MAFSSRAAQKQFDDCGCMKASRPLMVGRRSSTRTSTHSPHHHRRKRKTPWALASVWSAGTTR
ncbi:hypothetical protein M5D96_011874 [Drosophila gunungcola]|uniref:Uncharacterized protein n=1 Tax=Drosophila gunungcola TaxID=103775 RepID=A0A9P9YEB7_9MUSC|nr:hypothetical protein M5D96_011874 [Drosophila gunungcola]